MQASPYNNPLFAQGLAELVKSFIGNPEQELRNKLLSQQVQMNDIKAQKLLEPRKKGPAMDSYETFFVKEAQAAIAAGAPWRDVVKELKGYGINPRKLGVPLGE